MWWVSLIGGKNGTLCSGPTSFLLLGSPSPAFCLPGLFPCNLCPLARAPGAPLPPASLSLASRHLRLWDAFLVTVLFLWLHAALFLGQFSFFAAAWFLASWGMGGGHSEFLGLEGVAVITLDFRVGRVWNFMLNIILSILNVLLHFLRACRVAVLLVISRTWSCVFLPSSLAVPEVCPDMGVGCSAGRGWFWRVPLCLVIPWWVSVFLCGRPAIWVSHLLYRLILSVSYENRCFHLLFSSFWEISYLSPEIFFLSFIFVVVLLNFEWRFLSLVLFWQQTRVRLCQASSPPGVVSVALQRLLIRVLCTPSCWRLSGSGAPARGLLPEDGAPLPAACRGRCWLVLEALTGWWSPGGGNLQLSGQRQHGKFFLWCAGSPRSVLCCLVSGLLCEGIGTGVPQEQPFFPHPAPCLQRGCGFCSIWGDSAASSCPLATPPPSVVRAGPARLPGWCGGAGIGTHAAQPSLESSLLWLT